MASQAIFLYVTGNTCRKPTTSFLSVIKLPSSGMHFSEGNSTGFVARKTFLALMATVAHGLISQSINAM